GSARRAGGGATRRRRRASSRPAGRPATTHGARAHPLSRALGAPSPFGSSPPSAASSRLASPPASAPAPPRRPDARADCLLDRNRTTPRHAPDSRLTHLGDQVPEALETLGDAIGIERRGRDHEARDAEVAKAPHAVDVGSCTSRGDLDLRGITSDLGALPAPDHAQPAALILVGDAGEEAITVASRTTGGDVGVAADDDRYARLLDRLRMRLERPPAEELPGERLRLRLPQRAHGAHRFGGARGALPERDAE